MVSTPLKNIGQIGTLPQKSGWKIPKSIFETTNQMTHDVSHKPAMTHNNPAPNHQHTTPSCEGCVDTSEANFKELDYPTKTKALLGAYFLSLVSLNKAPY